MRDKFIELIIDGFRNCTKPHEVCSQFDLEALAYHLIANDVTLAKDNNVLTNAERIRTMSDEELAKFLDDINSQDCSATCIECIVDWLKQPVKEQAMDKYTAAEQAYKNGYEQGKKDAVKHGRWIEHTAKGENMAGEIVEIIISCNCSECRFDGGYRSNYCPNCGYKMDLEVDNG